MCPSSPLHVGEIPLFFSQPRHSPESTLVLSDDDEVVMRSDGINRIDL
jgi:hypothetical protein